MAAPEKTTKIQSAEGKSGFREAPKLTPKQLLFYHIAAIQNGYSEDQLNVAFMARHGQGGAVAQYMLDTLDATIKKGVAESKAKAKARRAKR